MSLLLASKREQQACEGIGDQRRRDPITADHFGRVMLNQLPNGSLNTAFGNLGNCHPE